MYEIANVVKTVSWKKFSLGASLGISLSGFYRINLSLSRVRTLSWRLISDRYSSRITRDYARSRKPPTSGSRKLRDLLLNNSRREFLNSEVEERCLDVEGPVCQVSISLVELRDYQREEGRKREEIRKRQPQDGREKESRTFPPGNARNSGIILRR